MEPPSIWLDTWLMNGILSPIPPGVWWDTKQTTARTFGSFHLHLTFWEESRSYLSRPFYLSFLLFVFCICKTIPWVLGLAPILSNVRICRLSLGSERERDGGTYCLTYLWGRTHPPLGSERPVLPHSRRQAWKSTKQKFRVPLVREKREVGRLLPEKRDLWTPRVGFEPTY